MRRLFLFLLLLNFAAHAQKIKWPHNKKAVIVLTYDDALASQLKVAVPQLESAHLPATFFLTSDINIATIPQWRKIEKKGYELGNHTLLHPCLPAVDNPTTSESYTVSSMIHEIAIMNSYLFAVDGKTTRTYAYPCTDTTAGGKSYVGALKNVVKYARIGGDADTYITDFKHLNPLQVPSFGLEGHNTGAELIAYVKKVQQSGGMGVFMFHGVGGDYITVSAEAHQALLDYLKKNKKDIWVATFQDAMDYVMQPNK